MKYLAAYALLALSGKKDITAADIKKVLGDAHITADDEDIKRLLQSVKGKPIHQLIADGSKLIGGSSAPPAPAGKGAPAKATQAPKKEEPKKDDKKPAQKKKEAPPPPPEQQQDFMAGGLFD